MPNYSRTNSGPRFELVFLKNTFIFYFNFLNINININKITYLIRITNKYRLFYQFFSCKTCNLFIYINL